MTWWEIVLIAVAADVRPATPGASPLDEVTQRWLATACGLRRPVLTLMAGPSVWRVDERGQR